MDQQFSLLGLAATSFVVALSGALMPGPLLVLTISESTVRGPIAGPAIVLGHAILEVGLIVAIVMGLDTFFSMPEVVRVISLAGGVVMGWMGQGMVRSARKMSLNSTAARRSSMNPVLAGILVSLSNPYWIFWWATVGIVYIAFAKPFSTIGIVVFFAGHILADLCWYWLVSFTTATGKRFLSDAGYRRMIVVCGIILVAFGLRFVWTGFTGLGDGGKAQPAMVR